MLSKSLQDYDFSGENIAINHEAADTIYNRTRREPTRNVTAIIGADD